MCLTFAALGPAAAPLRAQNANTVSTPSPPPRQGTVGPEQLRDFSLGGPRTTPADPAPDPEVPAPRRTPAPATPTAEAPAPARQVARTPAPVAAVPIARSPTPERTTPVAPRDVSSTAPPTDAVSLDLAPATPAPLPAPSPGFGSAFPPPQARSTAVQPPAPSEGGPTWPWLLAAAVLGAAGAWWWRRRREEGRDDRFEAVATAAPAPAPAPPPPAPPPSTFVRTRIPPVGSAPPAPAPGPAPAPPAAPARPGGIVATRLRATIELALRAEAAVLDDNELAIQFELVITNSGSAPARDVIVEALALNAGETQDAEIATFFARPDATGGVIDMIGPLDQTSIRSVVRMPRAAMREYQVEGRRLLVPVLAFNAGYRFGSGGGRTSGAWLIGRGKPGAERLGPLRLDQGPQRWTDLSQKTLEPAVRR